MVEDLTFRVLLEAQDNMSKKLEGVANQVNDLEKKATESSKKMELSFANLAKSVGALASVAVITDFAKSTIELAGNLQQANIAFETMLGSAEQAQELLFQLGEFAKTTPFELTGIRQNAKQLLAMGITAQDLLPTLKSLGDVSAGLSVPLERLALNYGQVIAQGRLTGRELRDFTIAGVPLLDELSIMLGKSKSAIQDMVSGGEVGSDIIVQAFKNMSSEGGRFANLMDKQSKTFQGAVSNMQDSLDQLKERLGTPLLDSLTETVQGVTQRIENVSDEMINTFTATFSSILESGGLLASGVLDLTTIISKSVEGYTLALNAMMTEVTQDNRDLLVATTGDWRDTFLYISLGLQALTGVFKTFATIVAEFIQNPVEVALAGADLIGQAFWDMTIGVGKAFENMGARVGNIMTNLVNNKVIGNINKFIVGVNDVLGTSIGTVGLIAKQSVDTVGGAFTSAFGAGSETDRAYQHFLNVTTKTFAGADAEMTSLVDGLEDTYFTFFKNNLPNYVKSGTSSASKLGSDNLSVLGDMIDELGEKTETAGGKNEDTLKEQEKRYKELEKAVNKMADSQVDATENIRESIKGHLEQLVDLKDEYKELEAEGKKALQELAKEFSNITGGTDEALAERVVSIDNTISELRSKLGQGDLDRSEVNDIRAEIKQLEEEKRLAIENTTQSAIDAAKKRDEMNETQRILFEEQEELQALEEKKRLFEEEFTAKKESLEKQTHEVVAQLGQQLEEYDTQLDKVRSLFGDHFGMLETETRGHVLRMIQEYDKLIEKAGELQGAGIAPGSVNIGSSLPQPGVGSMFGSNAPGGVSSVNVDLTINTTLPGESDAIDIANEVNRLLQEKLKNLQIGAV